MQVSILPWESMFSFLQFTAHWKFYFASSHCCSDGSVLYLLGPTSFFLQEAMLHVSGSCLLLGSIFSESLFCIPTISAPSPSPPLSATLKILRPLLPYYHWICFVLPSAWGKNGILWLLGNISSLLGSQVTLGSCTCQYCGFQTIL